ncbi:MAG: hypothetical protein U0271_27920 [Polyangiaceae bacterium]
MNSAVNRVPRIVLLYWIIKIAATTLGETGADMFSMTWSLGYGVTILLFLGLFAIAAGIKIATRRYHPVLYWVTFTTSAIAGTAISDFIDRTLELGYALGSLVLVGLLAIILAAWYRSQRSLQVELITTAGAEIFYWLGFLVANTLGTAAGDYMADDLELGFITSALVLGGVLGAVALLQRFTKASRVALFWIAFVVTRPFGATFGDFLTKSRAQGGIALGTVVSSILFGAALVIAVARETQLERRRVRQQA